MTKGFGIGMWCQTDRKLGRKVGVEREDGGLMRAATPRAVPSCSVHPPEASIPAPRFQPLTFQIHPPFPCSLPAHHFTDTHRLETPISRTRQHPHSVIKIWYANCIPEIVADQITLISIKRDYSRTSTGLQALDLSPPAACPQLRTQPLPPSYEPPTPPQVECVDVNDHRGRQSSDFPPRFNRR